MNSNKRAPKSLPTCGTIRGARELQVQLKNGLAGTKRYADLSAGDAPIAYQSSHRFIPRGSAQADAKLKRTVDVGQQPQRRPAGRCRSVGVRARWNRRRLVRAREGSQYDRRCQIPLIFPSRCSAGRRPDQAKPTSASAPVARAPASTAEAANNSAKKNCRRRPAAAAPPSRPVQVGRRQSALESARLVRAREGSQYDRRCQIPLIFPSRCSAGRRPDQAKPTSASAPVARAPASTAEAANNSAKKNCRRRPAAAAPPSRPVQVGRRQSALESAPSRARA